MQAWLETMKNKLIVPALCLSALSTAMLSAPANAITLEQAWQAAKKNDPDFKQAQIGVSLGESEVDTSRSALLPSVSATASSTAYNNTDNTNSYGVQLSQTLWNSAYWSDLSKSEASAVEAKLELTKAQEELAANLINAYLDLASAQDNLDLAVRKQKEGDKLLAITQKRFQAGKVKSVDLEEMRANNIEEESAIYSNQSTLEEKKAGLTAYINSEPTEVHEISTDNLTQPKMLLANEREWLTLAQDNSPELLAALQKVKVAQLAVKEAQAGYYPTVTSNLGYDDENSVGDGQFSAGVTLSVPLDTNGATQAQVQQADLKLLDAKQDVRAVNIAIKKQVQTQFAQIQLYWKQVEMAKKLVSQREKVLKSQQALYNAGMAAASDVIDAHNNLFSARNELRADLYSYWRQRVALWQTAGKLNDSAIATLTKALQP